MASRFELDAGTPAQRLRELGLDARKSLGQHFLHDRNVVRRIVEFSGVTSDDTVVEVGPGLGILTTELASRAKRVVAIEKDAALVEALRDVVPDNVDVTHADALGIDFSTLVGDSQYKVVANLPYNIATHVIRLILESEPPATSLTVMVQREVAGRMTASPPDMNLLGLAAQFYGTPKVGFRVGKGAFTPPPTVESAVVRIDVHQPPLAAEEHERFFELARGAFQTRRKQLAGAVATRTGRPKEEIRDTLAALGISRTARPEELTVQDWVRLFNALNPQCQ